jgi:N-acetylglucosamine-6-phosphate deacetylase
MTLSGFVDLQVNGYAGVDFTSPSLTMAQIESTIQALFQRGTSLFLPTVITTGWDTYTHVLPLLAEAIADPKNRARILGIHLEGPFLSPEDGARGVHPKIHIRPPDRAALEALIELAGGSVRLLTLAPELPGALDLIHWTVERGIIVAIGHTLADSQTIQAAVAAGARLSTHLGNGIPNHIHRHVNPLWAQLAEPALTAMLITDGHHLPADFVRAALAAKGIQRVIVTSDAAPAAGMPPGEYDLFGVQVRLEANGRLHSPVTGTLAGSAATMLDCMNWLAGLGALDEAGLWAVGRDNALRVLGLPLGSFPSGQVHYQHNRFAITKK